MAPSTSSSIIQIAIPTLKMVQHSCVYFYFFAFQCTKSKSSYIFTLYLHFQVCNQSNRIKCVKSHQKPHKILAFRCLSSVKYKLYHNKCACMYNISASHEINPLFNWTVYILQYIMDGSHMYNSILQIKPSARNGDMTRKHTVTFVTLQRVLNYSMLNYMSDYTTYKRHHV